ncbi:hypothetical protein EV360DRAFT_74881 [Lentinula raphanica]|nr:hypothetical protein EV360DRAFT_74881 [Lentinula raphanica]
MSSKVSIINEPVAVNTMDLYRDFHLQFPNIEKHPSLHAPPPYTQVHAHPHFDQTSDDSSPHQSSNTQRCHASRLRRVILPAIVAMVSLGGLLVLSCISAGLSGVEGADGLLKRATDDNGTFVNNKLYLIIVFVVHGVVEVHLRIHFAVRAICALVVVVWVVDFALKGSRMHDHHYDKEHYKYPNEHYFLYAYDILDLPVPSPSHITLAIFVLNPLPMAHGVGMLS